MENMKECVVVSIYFNNAYTDKMTCYVEYDKDKDDEYYKNEAVERILNAMSFLYINQEYAINYFNFDDNDIKIEGRCILDNGVVYD